MVKSDEFENSLPPYIFPLNPDYVAARSLRSLRSNNKFIRRVLSCPLFSSDFFNNLRFSFVVKIARQTLVLIESFQKIPEDCKTWFLVLLFFFLKGVSCVWDIWGREFTCFQSHTRWMPWSFPRLSNDWCIIS